MAVSDDLNEIDRILEEAEQEDNEFCDTCKTYGHREGCPEQGDKDE